MKKFGEYAKWVVAFIFAVAVIAVYKTFDNFRTILDIIGIVFDSIKPFVVAFVIAYVLNLPTKKISRALFRVKFRFISKHSYGISILLSYVLAAIIIALTVSAVIPAIYNNFYDFYLNLNVYADKANEYLSRFEILKQLNIYGESGIDFSSIFTSFMSTIDNAKLEKYIVGLFSATSSIVSIFISLIISVYMLLDKERIADYLKKLLYTFARYEKTNIFLSKVAMVNEIFTKYIFSRLICCIVMGVVSSLVLSIMRVKYAFALGMLIGICDLIPYFGSIIATGISIIVNLLSSGLFSSVIVGVVLLVLQQIDGNVLSPKIMGETLKLRPLVIVFAVIVGGSLFSVVGMVLSVPCVAVIKVLIDEFVLSHEEKNNNEKGENP